MKKNKLAFSFILLICSIGCTEQAPYDPLMPNYWGYVEAKFNGQIWQPSPYVLRSSGDHSKMTICMDYRNVCDERESLWIENVPKYSGVHKIEFGMDDNETGIGSHLTLSDGDVFGDYFQYNTILGKSEIEISEWDSISGHIKGRFDVRLLRATFHDKTFAYPDTLQIDGKFITKYETAK